MIPSHLPSNFHNAYPHNVITIHEYNNVPAVLGTINLNQQIQEGAELDPVDLKHARSTATALRGLLDVGAHPELNEEVVRGAELRATAIENIHASLEYAPSQLVQLLQNINANIEAVRDEARVGRAETNNALARIRNRFITPDALVPVQKVTAGSGIQRARALALPPNVDQNARQALEAHGAANPTPAIGTSPDFFNGNIDTLQHPDILKLVCFYNDNMGIVPGVGLVTRKQAVRSYLTTF